MENEIIQTKSKIDKLDKYIIGMFIVIVILVVISNIITIQLTKKTLHNNTNTTEIFNNGIKIGVVLSLNQILNSTNNCQIASVTYQDFNRQIVDVACVRQLLIENNITLK